MDYKTKDGHKRDPYIQCNFVTLIMGESREEIRVNKVVLSEDSFVFRNIFFGTNAGHERVFIPGADPHVFQKLINSICSKQFLPEPTIEKAWELYRIYRQYECEELWKQALVHLMQLMQSDEKTIWEVFSWARNEGDEIAELNTRKMLIQYGTKLLTESRMNEASLDMWVFLYQQEDFNLVDEYELFRQLTYYHRSYSELFKFNPSYWEDIRTMLYNIRFLTMSLDNFKIIMRDNELVSDPEIWAISSHIRETNSNIPYPIGFSESRKPRCPD